jgi:(1->4)-alpha-D-glucan 1-alpha-D-glucosylmutase
MRAATNGQGYARVPLRATYRVQLTADFGFEALAAQVDYLADLGVSHVYASPILQAARGSTHGYDVVDPGRISKDLGGELGFARLREALGKRGLGLVVDIVPNHMSVGDITNHWWWDVLENGPSSHFAAHFDVDWVPGASRRENRILMPILGERYGDAVQQAKIQVARRGGSFIIKYFDHVLPLAPRSLDWILRPAGERSRCDQLHFLAGAVDTLPRPTQTDRRSTARRHRDKAVIGVLLARLFQEQPECAQAVDEVIAEINADPARLDALLERQNFRLAFWRTASSELGYRRFFDVQTLVGLRVEDPAVLEDTHRLVFAWLSSGLVDGVRVDHPDGLRDPDGYFASLRSVAPDAWIVAEKILVGDERLPASWPVDGTTGYDFLAAVDALARDPEGEAALSALAEQVTGAPQDCREMARTAKKEVLRDVLGSELARLEDLWHKLCETDMRGRDYTRDERLAALAAALIELDVYRTYRRPGAPATAGDVARVETAIAAAKAANPDLPEDIFAWLLAILVGHEDAQSLRERELALRFQQVTGALMAKGVEDTVFYRHVRLLAANEVGSGPERFAMSPDDFHAMMARPDRLRTMLGTSTHDTKRAEDVRARLNVLSELPDTWREQVERWLARAAHHKTADAPDDTDVYFWLQTWVGAWPLSRERAWAAMEKSVREAKRRTAWTRQDAGYEAALRRLVEGTLADEALAGEVEAFVHRIEPAARVNALARTAIKLCAPGIPDLYQGTEVWEHSLVDPDNRRPVDFGQMRALLATARDAGPEAALARADDGLAKMWLTSRILALRARQPEVFAGGYVPLFADGARAAHVFGFVRQESMALLVPRLSARLARAARAGVEEIHGGNAARVWDDTHVRLARGRWRDALTGEPAPVGTDGHATVAALFARFPVALIVKES